MEPHPVTYPESFILRTRKYFYISVILLLASMPLIITPENFTLSNNINTTLIQNFGIAVLIFQIIMFSFFAGLLEYFKSKNPEYEAVIVKVIKNRIQIN